MDSSTLDFFFALLRSGLYGTIMQAADVPDTVDWRQVMQLAHKQTVMGLVFDAASRLPPEVQPPQDVKSQMLKLSLRVMQSHTLLNSALAEIVGFYRAHSIPCVLLKGQGVARCYRQPLLRQCGDIDLYVGKKNYRRSVELAMQELDSGDTEASESLKHYHFNKGRVTVELHRIAALMYAPTRSKKFDRWIEAELESPERLRRLDFDGAEVLAPSADFDAVFIFYHAWFHFVNGGIGLRQLCDWAMTLRYHKDNIDREALEKTLRKFGLMKPWQIFGCIAVERLGLPADMMPFYNPAVGKKHAWALESVMEGGNFGFHREGASIGSLRNLPLLRRKWILLRRLMRSYVRIFPIVPVESTCHVANTLAISGVNTVRQLMQKP